MGSDVGFEEEEVEGPGIKIEKTTTLNHIRTEKPHQGKEIKQGGRKALEVRREKWMQVED